MLGFWSSFVSVPEGEGEVKEYRAGINESTQWVALSTKSVGLKGIAYLGE